MTDISLTPPKTLIIDLLMTLFLRIVALGCLWYGLNLWGALIGYSHGGALRFDLLSADLKAANSTLAVLYPVAAIGLWLRGAWGPVIWTAAAIMEITMHQGLAAEFGSDKIKMVAIAATGLIYIILRVSGLLLRPKTGGAGHA